MTDKNIKTEKNWDTCLKGGCSFLRAEGFFCSLERRPRDKQPAILIKKM